jgi:early secretory antigenic target protein ESAT-6
VGQIVYNFGGIAGGAGELDGAVGQTAALLEEGQGSLARLAGQWESTASMSWQEAQTRWDSNSTELNLALQNLAAAVRDSGETMNHLDNGIAGSF